MTAVARGKISVDDLKALVASGEIDTVISRHLRHAGPPDRQTRHRRSSSSTTAWSTAPTSAPTSSVRTWR